MFLAKTELNQLFSIKNKDKRPRYFRACFGNSCYITPGKKLIILAVPPPKILADNLNRTAVTSEFKAEQTPPQSLTKSLSFGYLPWFTKQHRVEI